MAISASDYTVTQALNGLTMQLKAGVALPKALKTCGKGVRWAARPSFMKAAEKAEAGAPFEEILEQMSPVLSFAERAAMAAGWAGGRIDEVIASIVKRRDVLRETGKMIRGKMIQPGLSLLGAAFIVPAVPLLSGKIDGNEYMFRAFVPIAIAVAVWAAGVQIFKWREWSINHRPLNSPPASPGTFDYILFYTPLVWFMERQRNLAEFCDLLAYMLLAGMRIDLALKQCARAMPNGVYRMEVNRLSETTRAGKQMSDLLVIGRVWPEELVAVLSVAEASGDLETSLLRQGTYWRDMYLDSVKRWGSIIAWTVYILISAYIAYQIFIMAQVYLNALTNANNGVFPN